MGEVLNHAETFAVIFVSDVHGASSALSRLLRLGRPTVILGDLVNLTDYRTGEGAIADVLGMDFARQSARARALGDFRGMRSLWVDHAGANGDEIRAQIGLALASQYEEMGEAMRRGTGFVIHGNVDRPARLIEAVPDSMSYAHGVVIDMDGIRMGLIGGGVETPMAVEGEVTDEEMSRLLRQIGDVDVLATHVPPAVRSLRRDVITGRDERGSGPIHDYLLETQPRFHFFGDVHQAQASQWRIGRTTCHNAGYFRATGRYLELVDGIVQVHSLG